MRKTEEEEPKPAANFIERPVKINTGVTEDYL